MQAPKVKLKLKQLHWQVLADDLKAVTQVTPLKDWELESYIIADLYIKKMSFFEIYPFTKKGVKLSLTMIQAIAINQLLGATSAKYNALLRIMIEPKLIL